LIKRFNFFFQTTGNDISLPNTPYTKFFNYDSATPNDGAMPTAVDAISALFAFRSGGMRFKAWDSSSDLMTVRAIQEHAQTVPESYTSYLTLKNVGPTTVLELESQRVKGAAEFQIPFYAPVYTFINAVTFNFHKSLFDIIYLDI